MGWNFRKSIKIGPARINLSKSGVGYSVGAGGVRYTKKAGGKKKKGSNLWEIIKGFFCLIIIIAIIGLIRDFWKWIVGIGIAIAAGAAVWILLRNKLKAAEAETPLEAPVKDSDVFTYTVVGLSFYMDTLMSMMAPNDLYGYRKQELIDTCNTDINIYKQTIEGKQVELIPDPENPHDSNAIKVLLGGKQIGFIPANACTHILDLMKSDRIIRLAYTVEGGKYKRVNEDYDSIKDKSTYSMESGEDDYSVTLYIREKLQ